MTNEKKDKKNKEDCSLLREKRLHAWDYFALHANQRISVFKTYIVILALFITSSGFMIIRFPSPTMADEFIEIGLCLIFIILTIIFYLLDNRNRCLIKMAEEALRDVEKKQQEKEKNDCKDHCKESCGQYCDKCVKLYCNKRDGISNEYLFTIEDKNAKNTFFRHTVCFRIIFGLGFFMTVVLMLYSAVSLCYYEKGDYSGSYLILHTHDKIECGNLFLDNDHCVQIND